MGAINSIIEISKKKTKAGRTPTKLILHEIHKSEDKNNLNGINWVKEYAEQNIESVKGMPLVAQFLDDDKTIPFGGHGNMKIEENKVIYEDSLVVGSFDDAYIVEDIEVNNKKIDALVGVGYIYNQRFPALVDYLQDQYAEGNKIEGSVEICADESKGNNKIIYDGGWKEKGRKPQVYQYSGHALIIGDTPADDSALMLELNSYKKKELENKKVDIITEDIKEKKINKGGSTTMNVEELKEKITKLSTQLAELNSKVTKLNSTNVAKDNKIAELNEALVVANKSLEEANNKYSTLEVEYNTVKEDKEKMENEKQQAEVNAYFETEIPKNKFDETEVNTLKEYVEKCDLQGLKDAEASLIVKRFKEGRKSDLTETNSSKTENLFFSTREEKVEVNDVEAGKSLFF